MNIKEAKKLIENELLEKRFKYSFKVVDAIVKLTEIYNGDKSKAELAGTLYDYCKYDDLGKMYRVVHQHDLDNNLLSRGSEILHGPVCVASMEADCGIEDEEVLLAIKCHTTGRKETTKAEKLVFTADYIEPGRKTSGVEEIRSMAYNQGNLNKIIYEISKRTVLFLVSKDITVYGSTIECLNYYSYNDQKIKGD